MGLGLVHVWWLRWSEVKISVKHTICTRNKRTLPQQNLRSILWCMYNMNIYICLNKSQSTGKWWRKHKVTHDWKRLICVWLKNLKQNFFSAYKWVYSCHEKTSHHNKNKHDFKFMYIVAHVHLFVLVYDGHTISMVLCTLSFEILKYISITTCKQHNSPVGSLGFWVDQFLWDSWVPLTYKFTSSTNSSFFLFMQIHDISSPWKTLIPRYTILNHISYIKYK